MDCMKCCNGQDCGFMSCDEYAQHILYQANKNYRPMEENNTEEKQKDDE